MKHRLARLIAAAMGLAAVSACTTPAPYFAPDALSSGEQALLALERSGFQRAWATADLSFAGYDGVLLLQRGLSYRHAPRPAHRRLGSSNYALPEGFEASLLRGLQEIFAEELTRQGPWRVEQARGPGTVVVAISLVDLVVYAPLTWVGGERLTWVQRVADVTVVIELLDSQSGAVLARFAERRSVRPVSRRAVRTHPGDANYEMRRIFRAWARTLRTFVDVWDLASARDPGQGQGARAG